MTTSQVLEAIRQKSLAGCALILLESYEEERWEDELARLAGEMERGLVTWTAASGAQPPLTQSALDPLDFLNTLKDYPAEHFFLLKDLHPFFNRAEVVRKLRDLIPVLRQQRQTILLFSPTSLLPGELSKDVSIVSLPLPGLSDLQPQLEVALEQNPGFPQPDQRQRERLLQAALGLTALEARQAFAQVLQRYEDFSDDVCAAVVHEKRHMVQGSDLLEFFDLEEGLDDVGGLDGLKEWMSQRAEAFSEDARARGISYPKGVLLTGVQGCGKSLSAKAIARLLGFPLVRMDIAQLLESQRGSSEQNLRDVLRLMEAIAPSVLWLEEIDKAFAGFAEEATHDATMSRIVGRFLTWLQEHTAPVFVVATANNVGRLPPELLRRGRFDELFFVDLPNFHERQSIFQIHLHKRGWKSEKFDIEALSNVTEGYSGAEIELIVNAAVIDSYSNGNILSQQDLLESAGRTVPLSVTMEDEIFRLREWARSRCRPATPDFRIMQVMEEEERRGELPLPEELPQPKWLQLADAGQIPAAIIEHVRHVDHVTWSQLLEDFAPYLEVRGEFGLAVRSDPKIVLWTRISQPLADIVIDLIDRKRIYAHITDPLRYQGTQHPTLPHTITLVASRSSQPVWVPTCLRLLPPATGSGRLADIARIRMGKGRTGKG